MQYQYQYQTLNRSAMLDHIVKGREISIIIKSKLMLFIAELYLQIKEFYI